ncbi:AI-2E family transporter [Corynebacterium mucifaciens]|nr:AI-2E family transporter [Corynebacterium mucifaciens]
MSEPIQTTGQNHEDRVDRNVVFNNWLASSAKFTLRILVIAVFLYAVGQLIGAFWAGILPVVLALIVCTVLAPIAAALRRLRVPAALAALLTMLLFFGVLAALAMIIAPNLVGQSRLLYIQALEGLQRLQLWAQGPPLNLDPESLNEGVDEITLWIQNQAGAIAGGVFSGINTAAGLSVTLMVLVVLTFFFLKDGHRFLPWLRSATGGRTGLYLTELLTRAWNTLSGFIRAQAVCSLVDAIVIGTGIAIVGVPMAFTLALITFVAGFIPIVGAVVAGALAVLIALVTLGFTKALIVLGIVLATQQLEGNVLSPLLQSRAMNLHPVIVLVSVTVGGALFGLIGGFLAVPTAAMIAVVYRYALEVLRINAGEIGANDIDLATHEGEIIAEIVEAESVHKREEWRGEHEWVNAPAPDDQADDAKRERFGTTSLQKLRVTTERIGRLRGKAGASPQSRSTERAPSEHTVEPER